MTSDYTSPDGRPCAARVRIYAIGTGYVWGRLSLPTSGNSDPMGARRGPRRLISGSVVRKDKRDEDGSKRLRLGGNYRQPEATFSLRYIKYFRT